MLKYMFASGLLFIIALDAVPVRASEASRPASMVPDMGAQLSDGLSNMQSLTKDLMGNQRLNVKDFGAKGNGIADDTSAIQQVLSTAKANTTIYFPAGVYNVSKPLVLKQSVGVRLTGDGSATVLLATAPMQDLLHIKANALRFLMDFMTVDANNMAETAIRLDGGYYVVFNSLYVTNPRNIGLHAGSPEEYAGNEMLVTDCYFTGLRQIDDPKMFSKTGILVQRFSDCIIHGGFVRGFVEAGLDLDAPDLLVSHIHVYKLPAAVTKVGIRVKRCGSALVNNQIDNMLDAYIEMLGEVGVIEGNLFVRTYAVFGHDKYTDIKKTPGVVLGNDQYCARGITISGNSYYSRRVQNEYHGEKGDVDPDQAGLVTAQAVNCEDVVCVDNAYGDLCDRRETRASGQVVVPSGATQAFVKTSMLGKIQQVQLTPQGMNQLFWGVDEITDQGFAVRLSKTSASPITFFWTAQSACSARPGAKQLDADFH